MSPPAILRGLLTACGSASKAVSEPYDASKIDDLEKALQGKLCAKGMTASALPM